MYLSNQICGHWWNKFKEKVLKLRKADMKTLTFYWISLNKFPIILSIYHQSQNILITNCKITSISAKNYVYYSLRTPYLKYNSLLMVSQTSLCYHNSEFKKWYSIYTEQYKTDHLWSMKCILNHIEPDIIFLSTMEPRVGGGSK